MKPQKIGTPTPGETLSQPINKKSKFLIQLILAGLFVFALLLAACGGYGNGPGNGAGDETGGEATSSPNRLPPTMRVKLKHS